MTTDQTLLPDNCKNECPLIADPLPDQPIPSMCDVSEKYILELGRWMYRNRSRVIVALDQYRTTVPAPDIDWDGLYKIVRKSKKLSDVEEWLYFNDPRKTGDNLADRQEPAPIPGVQAAMDDIPQLVNIKLGYGEVESEVYDFYLKHRKTIKAALIAAGAVEK